MLSIIGNKSFKHDIRKEAKIRHFRWIQTDENASVLMELNCASSPHQLFFLKSPIFALEAEGTGRKQHAIWLWGLQKEGGNREN